MKRGTMILGLIAALCLCVAPIANAVTITIQNADGPNEGFNDPGAPTVAPGNPGVTLGAQRLFAFQYAADIWGACLNSPATIIVNASMNPLFCNATSATLGSAGTNFIWRDFTNAPKVATWYPDALADALFGSDLNPGNADVVAQFNSSLNGSPSCLGGIGWYYGTNQIPGSDIDFISVVAHEIGHGIGFQTFQSSTGIWFNGFQDTYGTNMFHNFAIPADYPSMTNAQRAAGNIGDPNLVWNGANVKAIANSVLTSGSGGAGRARLHGPNPYQSGSSLSHWSSGLAPNQLMEPFYTGANHNVFLELNLLKDVGWSVGNPTTMASASGSQVAVALPNLTVNIELNNSGVNDAFNVQAVMTNGPAWLTINDANCSYGTISAGTSENGSPDSYEVDLTNWPGGTFTVDLDVTWEDNCGLGYNTTVQKAFDDLLTGAGDSPLTFNRLEQNIPNPFNPTTEIVYELEKAGHVELAIYDVAGKLVRTLINGHKPAGVDRAAWNGRDNNGRAVSSGVYFYRINAGEFKSTKRMVLLK
jgi:hypothetical protein